MVTNANAGLRWLAKETPDLDETRDAMKNVVSAGHRASEVIESTQAMFKKDNQVKTAIDLNNVIQDILGLVQGELQTQGILVQSGLTRPLPLVLGHSGQLQQVILNLVRNANDAMDSVSGRARVLRIKTAIHDADGLLLPVEDWERASLQKTSTASSSRSSRQNRKPWEWGCRSVGRSSKPITAGFGLQQALIMDQCLTFYCRQSDPKLNSDWCPSTTLADLFTLRFVANPFSAMRTARRWWSSDEFEDRVAYGW